MRDENKDQFEKFKKDYTYFKPYFDFVMFKLRYRMYGCLLDNDIIFCHNDRLSSKRNIRRNVFLPYLSKCSDKELQIKEVEDETPDAMIDPNGMQMFANDYNNSGSHILTCRTILNQLLIQSEAIFKYFSIYKLNAISALIDCGFIRAASKESSEILICRKDLLSDNLKEKINVDRICDFGLIDDTNMVLLSEYFNVINKEELQLSIKR